MNILTRRLLWKILGKEEDQTLLITRLQQWNRGFGWLSACTFLFLAMVSFRFNWTWLAILASALLIAILTALGRSFLYQGQIELYQKMQQVQAQALVENRRELECFKTVVVQQEWEQGLATLQASSRTLRKIAEQEGYTQLENNLQATELATVALKMNAKVLQRLAVPEVKSAEAAPELVDLNYVLHQVLINLRTAIEQKQAEIYTFPLPIVLGKEDDFVLIFQQLILHNLNHNQSLIPRMNIVVESTDQYHYLGFRGNGKEESQAQEALFLFDKTWRRRLTRPAGDLSLQVCEKLLEQYKGKLTIHREAGKPATFCVKLPSAVERA